MVYNKYFSSLAQQLASEIAYHISVLQRTFPFTENLLDVDHDHSEQLARRRPDAELCDRIAAGDGRTGAPASANPLAHARSYTALTTGGEFKLNVRVRWSFQLRRMLFAGRSCFKDADFMCLAMDASRVTGRGRLMVAIAAESAGKCKAMWCPPLVPSLLWSPSFAYLGTLSVNNLV